VEDPSSRFQECFRLDTGFSKDRAKRAIFHVAGMMGQCDLAAGCACRQIS
jgi:hypothetical protein